MPGCTLQDDGLQCGCEQPTRCPYSYPLVQYDVPTAARLNAAYSATREGWGGGTLTDEQEMGG
jgi:hypothetical protein